MAISLAPVIRQRFFDANGEPLAGGKVYTYAAETLTPLVTYSDADLTPNTNPIILDGDGYCDMWLGEFAYKIRLTDSLDNEIWVRDNIVSESIADGPSAQTLENVSFAVDLSSNAATIRLTTGPGSIPTIQSPVKVAFRSTTLTNGNLEVVEVSTPVSTIISSGSTAGHSNGVPAPIYVGLIKVGSSVELCWSSTPFDERGIVTTTAEGGSGGADSYTAVYSTTARVGVPVRMIGRMISTQATAGTWVTAPKIQPGDMASMLSMPATIGANQYVTAKRAIATSELLSAARAFATPRIQKFTSGSGNYNATLLFDVASLSSGVTAGDTYSDGTTTYTIAETLGASVGEPGIGVVVAARGAAIPVSTTLTRTSGSGDSTIVFSGYRRPLWLNVKAAGGGGGAGAPGGGAGGAGGTTTFGTSLITCNGGGASPGGSGAVGGAKGTASINSPAIGKAWDGEEGGPGGYTADSNGGKGGGTVLFGGGAAMSYRGLNGKAAIANSGGGGGGGSGFTGLGSSSGGGGGGSVDAVIPGPSITYSYAIGAAGTAGSTGGSGIVAGVAAAGYIEVHEHYQ